MYLKFADAPASAPSRKQQKYQQPGSLRGVQLRRAMLVVLAIAFVGSVFIAQAVDLIMAYNSAEVPDGDEPSQSAESADD